MRSHVIEPQGSMIGQVMVIVIENGRVPRMSVEVRIVRRRQDQAGRRGT